MITNFVFFIYLCLCPSRVLVFVVAASSMATQKRKFDASANSNNQNYNSHHVNKKRRPENGSPSYGGLSQDIPSLPPIPREYEKMVFTHPSIDAKFEGNYERLEFLGDAQIEHIASIVIFERYTDATPGKMSSIREKLVNNETLSAYSRMYGFDKKLRITTGTFNPNDWTKINGDVFEAYVAAVILSDVDREYGFEAAMRWLTQLWEPKFKELGLNLIGPKDIKSKETLARNVLVKGAKMDYREVKEKAVHNRDGTHLYVMEAFYTGLGYTDVFLGQGQGDTKNSAGQAAAKKALESPIYEEIKSNRQKFLDDKAEKEKQEAAEEQKMNALQEQKREEKKLQKAEKLHKRPE